VLGGAETELRHGAGRVRKLERKRGPLRTVCSTVEGAPALDRNGPPLRPRLVAVIAATDDGLTLRRMAAALVAAGLGRPLVANGVEEASVAAGAGNAVVAFACDLFDPARLAALRRLRKLVPKAGIVVLSPPTHASGVRRALDAGADGVVFESELEGSLAPSMSAVAAGQAAVPRRARGGLHKPAFSHRERQVLGQVAAGLTNSEIAAALFLSESTVKSHLSSAFAKLGVRSRKEAAAVVLDSDHEQGLGALVLGAPPLAGVGTGSGP
jgi:DNA-binding NarL/FixJ family response regulator